jgi:hypothetical protein
MRSASLNCLLRGINWSFSTSSFRSEVYDHLRANGHLVAEMPLQPSETALTLYWKNGKVATTDGPYAETKEQLGGIQILEARDLNHAIQVSRSFQALSCWQADDWRNYRPEQLRRINTPRERWRYAVWCGLVLSETGCAQRHLIS